MKHLIKTQQDIIKNPLLDIAININGKYREFQAVIDTRFDGYISFNQDMAQILNLVPTKKVKTVNADNQITLNYVYVTQLSIGTLDLDYTDYRVMALGKQNQIDEIIIGQALLDRFCRDNNLSMVFNYPENQIYFE